MMDEELFEEQIESREIFKGKILGLYLDKVRLPNNNISTREKVVHPGAVGIVPVNRQREVILVKQFRYPPNKILLEIPAGKLDKGEDPKRCASRELKEEVGAESGDIIKLASFYTTPGFSNELLVLFLAVNFQIKDNNLDEDEFLKIKKFTLSHANEMIRSGEIQDAKTIIGIKLARDYFNDK